MRTHPIFSFNGLWPAGISLIRIITGIFLVIHGTQITRTPDMNQYGQWLTDLGTPFPLTMAYLGKASELVCGLLLTAGLMTKVASFILFVTFAFISFVMGQGNILTDAQHPFLFALLSLTFLFNGPGVWSADFFIANKK
jgi:putative oxidoreductase